MSKTNQIARFHPAPAPVQTIDQYAVPSCVQRRKHRGAFGHLDLADPLDDEVVGCRDLAADDDASEGAGEEGHRDYRVRGKEVR